MQMKESCEEIFLPNNDLHAYMVPRPLPVVGLLSSPAVHPIIMDLNHKLMSAEPQESMHVVSFDTDEKVLKKKDRRPYPESGGRIEGLMKRHWARKHQELVAGAMCVLFDWDLCPSSDRAALEQSAAAAVDHARGLLKGRSTKVILVLHTQLPPLEITKGLYFSMDDAMNVLRRRCELESSKSICIIHLADLENSCMRMLRTARENAMNAYKDEIRHIKKLKNEIPKGQQGLFVRHRFKIGYFYDITADPQGALKYYQQSYQALRQISPSSESFSLLELKTSATVIMHRVCIVQLSPHAGGPVDPTAIRRSFEEHMHWFRVLSLYRNTFNRTGSVFPSAPHSPSGADSPSSRQGLGMEPPAQPPPGLMARPQSQRMTFGDGREVGPGPTASPVHELGGIVGSIGLWMHHRSIAQQFERFAHMYDEYVRRVGLAESANTARFMVSAANTYKAWRTFVASELQSHAAILMRCGNILQSIADYSFVPSTYIGQEFDPMLVEPKDPAWRKISRDEALWLSLFTMDTKATTTRMISLLDSALVRYRMLKLERLCLTTQIDLAGHYIEIKKLKEAQGLLALVQGSMKGEGAWYILRLAVERSLLKCYEEMKLLDEYILQSLTYVVNSAETEAARAVHFKALWDHLDSPCGTVDERLPTVPSPRTLPLLHTNEFLHVCSSFQTPYAYQNTTTTLRLTISTKCPRPFAISGICISFYPEDVPDVEWTETEFVHAKEEMVVDIPCTFSKISLVQVHTVKFVVRQNLTLELRIDGTRETLAWVKRMEMNEYNHRLDVGRFANRLIDRPLVRVLVPPSLATIILGHRSVVLQHEEVVIEMGVHSLGDAISGAVLSIPERNDWVVVSHHGSEGRYTFQVKKDVSPYGRADAVIVTAVFRTAGNCAVPITLTYDTPHVKALKVVAMLDLQVVFPVQITYTLHETLEWCDGPVVSHVPITNRSTTWLQKASTPWNMVGVAPLQSNPETGVVPREHFPTGRPNHLAVRITNCQAFEIELLGVELLANEEMMLSRPYVGDLPCRLSLDEDFSIVASVQCNLERECSPGTLVLTLRRAAHSRLALPPSIFSLSLPPIRFFTPYVTVRVWHPQAGHVGSVLPYAVELRNQIKVPLRLLIAFSDSQAFHIHGRSEWRCTLLPGTSQKFGVILFPIEVGVVALPQCLLKGEETSLAPLLAYDVSSSVLINFSDLT